MNELIEIAKYAIEHGTLHASVPASYEVDTNIPLNGRITTDCQRGEMKTFAPMKPWVYYGRFKDAFGELVIRSYEPLTGHIVVNVEILKLQVAALEG